CAYVARYVTKKITGDMAEEHYKGREPEYVVMSRRPGIGRGWLEKFVNDVYPHDYVVIRNGIKCKPPRYYDKIYDEWNSEEMHNIKTRRKFLALQSDEHEKSWERMEVKEAIQVLKAQKLIRPLEGEI
ncbi:hypothetical protein, partial [Megamonas sp.]